ncbi:class I SAM-dependent methyltransferase [Hartmannibacter diazotrophicus]|uniref:class I SAM-dependent methyltransferase n=1 Tax=Hartmannibacter diazotrophicus TaxID=1482074 RepID=UPI000C14F767|nr:class I SAM-dependent methyltransferase [Hartmannibacter diazotrophicus]
MGLDAVTAPPLTERRSQALAGAEQCLICAAGSGPAGLLSPLYPSMKDHEYGIERASGYFRCDDCGFVMQVPRVPAAEIPALYPDDYQSYSRPKKSLFGAMKRMLVSRDARTAIELAGNNAPRILEIGCGNGALLERILAINPKASVCGIDIKDLGLAANPDIEFHLGQLEDVDLADASFDLIYCSNLIEHVADPVGFLLRIKTLLRPNGKAMIITPNHLSLDRYVFGRRWGGYHFPRHLTLFDHRNVKTAMALSGFDVERIAGSYAWWAISVGNCLFSQSARRKRGMMFAGISLLFLPFDLLANLLRPHGSMTIVAKRPS